MDTPQIFGDYVEKDDKLQYLTIYFLPRSIPLRQRWRNTGLSADFIADYWANFFPDDEPSQKRQMQLKEAVSYIANELLENGMKYGYKLSEKQIIIDLYLHHSCLRFYLTNPIALSNVSNFQKLIHRLLSEDPRELQIQQIQRKADGQDNGSGLGFLTMITGYEARLAWKFEPTKQEPDVVYVTTMVELAI